MLEKDWIADSCRQPQVGSLIEKPGRGFHWAQQDRKPIAQAAFCRRPARPVEEVMPRRGPPTLAVSVSVAIPTVGRVLWLSGWPALTRGMALISSIRDTAKWSMQCVAATNSTTLTMVFGQGP